MPENEFEKQVQQKMDELQFVPSDAVWPEVERQIATRKKRRGLIFWLPLGTLLLVGAAWIYFSGNADAVIKRQPADKTNENASANNKNKAGNIPATTKASSTENIKTSTANADISAKSSVDAGNVSKSEKITVEKSYPYKNQNNGNHLPGINKQATGTKHKNVIAAINKTSNTYKNLHKTDAAGSVVKNTGRKGKVAGVIEIEKANTTVGSAIEEKDEAIAQSSQEKKEIIPAELLADSVASKNLVVKKTGNDSLVHVNNVDTNKAIAKTKTSNKTNKKFEWGINVNAGASSVSDGFTSFFSGAPTYDVAAFLSNQQSAPGNVTAGGSTAIAKPSDTKRGFSYTAGVFISKPLNKKINLLAGLNYSYYSNSIHVGAKSDSLGFALYQTGNVNSYTNRFHFIEIPVAIQIHGERFAVNAGLSFSVLAGTNTLLYKVQGNFYYKDNSLVNKLQAGILAGFSYRLFPATMPIEIGPQINYSLSNIFNKDLYGSRHLFFGGINAKIFLHKK